MGVGILFGHEQMYPLKRFVVNVDDSKYVTNLVSANMGGVRYTFAILTDR